MVHDVTPSRPHLRSRAVAAAVGLLILMGALLAILPAASPALGARAADFLRSLLGPAPVADLESASFWATDILHRLLQTRATAPDIGWASNTPATGSTAPAAPSRTNADASRNALPPSGEPGHTHGAGGPSAPAPNALTAPPQIGWLSYGPAVAGVPVMARSLIMVDPQRSYAGVALVRMDLSRLQLHAVPGFIEPAHPSGIDGLIPDIGVVPPAAYDGLVAGFNGGFKGLHGHYGMMVDGVTLLPPIDGMATVALYQDGSVRMGAWGRDLFGSPDMVAFRQNCPPLLDSGEINPALTNDARGAWGYTNSSDITWRTGLGLSQDSRYLIYAVGNGTNALFLAKALQEAGAYSAMQLDINQYYAHFVIYGRGPDGRPQASELLSQMLDDPRIFLQPDPRDFFYLTSRQ
jgi:hypothetical protein